MKKLPTKSISFILIISMIFSLVVPVFASEEDSATYFEDMPGSYTIIEEIETPYGTAYYVKKYGDVQARSVWDALDIIMAGASWADLFGNPSWKNFGWAVLDTVALLPVLPSSAYFRRGGKTFLKVDEVAKFAKTSRGKKEIYKVMKTYKYSDGISSKVTKEIKKKFKGKEGEKVLKLFKEAADKGLVGSKNQAGIKKISPSSKIGKRYTHEIKIVNEQYKDYRIFGYKTKSGEWVFDLFIKGVLHYEDTNKF